MSQQFTVLYEDNHLIAVHKPAGLLTQPSEISKDSLEGQLKVWLKNKYQKPGNVFLGVVHRLDKPVSGIVLFAKTSKALSRLNAAIKSKNCQKIYLAKVEGVPHPREKSLEHFLRHDDYQATISTAEDSQAKKALLQYQVIKEEQKSSLVKVTLETGRYHQIRAQLAAIGHPIIGDVKYGSREKYEEGAIALHHFQLSIEHPVKRTMMTVEAPCPFTT